MYISLSALDVQISCEVKYTIAEEFECTETKVLWQWVTSEQNIPAVDHPWLAGWIELQKETATFYRSIDMLFIKGERWKSVNKRKFPECNFINKAIQVPTRWNYLQYDAEFTIVINPQEFAQLYECSAWWQTSTTIIGIDTKIFGKYIIFQRFLEVLKSNV